MRMTDKLEGFVRDKKTAAAVLLGGGGMLLVLISSLMPKEKSSAESVQTKLPTTESVSGEYCSETEKRLEDFLRNIEGAGDVRVYLTVGTEERCVYAKEKKQSRSENKTEEDESYVIIGKGNEKNALIETIRSPEITGAVVACTGCDSPVVAERIYNAVSAALGIPSGKIFVTKLK